MTITYVSGSAANSVGSSVAVAAPATISSGNLLVAIVYQASNNTTGTNSAPSGWTQAASSGANTTGYGSMQVYTKTATAGEPSSYTFTGAGYLAASVLQYTPATLDASITFAESASSTTATSPAATASGTTDTQIVAFGAYHGSTFSTPTGTTPRAFTASAGNESLYTFDAALTASGAVPTYTSTLSASDGYVAATLLLSAPGRLATESWSGSTGAPWSSQWNTSYGSPGVATIQNGAGQLVSPGGTSYNSRRALLNGVATAADCELLVSWRMGADSVAQYAGFGINADSGVPSSDPFYPFTGYMWEADYQPSAGSSGWNLTRCTGGQQTTVTEGTLTLTGSTTYTIRMRRSAGVISVRVWDASTTEPSTWLTQYTDSSPLPAGWVLLTACNGSDAATRYALFENLTLTNASGTSLQGSATLTGTSTLTGSGAISTATNSPAPSSMNPVVSAPAFVPQPLVDQQALGFRVAVYDNTYTLQGYLNSYESASVAWQHLDVGTGSVVIGEGHPMVSFLAVAQAQRHVTPIVVTTPGGQRWSGRVEAVDISEGDGSTPSVPGQGKATITLVDEFAWLKRMFASPNGANAALTSMPLNDTRTGPIETVVKGFISDAIKRIGLSVFYVVPAPASDSSPSVTLSGRFTELDQLIVDALRLSNRYVTMTVWLPGDPQPSGAGGSSGVTLSSPTIVVDIATGADDPTIVWRDDTFITRKVSIKTPTASTAILAGSGTGTAQVFDTYKDTGLASDQGAFGFPEAYFTAGAATSAGATTQQDAQQQLLVTEGGIAVTATVQDGVPWTYLTDYKVGDIVGVSALGLDVRQRVTKVEIVDDAQGYRVVPTIGDDVVTLTPQQRLFHTIRGLSNRVAQLQTGT